MLLVEEGEVAVVELMISEELELAVALGIVVVLASQPLNGFAASFRDRYWQEDFDAESFVVGFVEEFVAVIEERREEVVDASSSSYSCSFPVLELLASVVDAYEQLHFDHYLAIHCPLELVVAVVS